MRKKLGLALGAGGSRGVAHIGFLQALEEFDIRPDFLTGCSMGAIVGACYAAGASPEELKKAVIGLNLSDLAALNFAPFRSNGLMRMTKARKLIFDLIGEKTFDELKIPFACVATDLEKGETVVLEKGNVIDCALASSSIPGVFTPAQVNGYHMLVDGGILERVPTKELKKMGAEIIVAMDVLGDLSEAKEPSGTLINTLLRVIDVMDTHSTMNKRRARKRYVDLYLEPDLGGMDQYQVKNLNFAYEKGYELGVAERENIKKLIED